MAIGFANSEPVSGVAGRCLNLFSAFYNVDILFRPLSSVCLLSVVCLCAGEVFGIFILAYDGVSFLLRHFLLKYMLALQLYSFLLRKNASNIRQIPHYTRF